MNFLIHRIYLRWMSVFKRDLFFEYICNKLISIHENITFIQVGAHNGIKKNPVHHFMYKPNHTGILVEPQPNIFAILQERLQKYPKFFFENIAIDTNQ